MFNVVCDCIKGKNKKQRGGKAHYSCFEEEESEKKRKDVAVHIHSLLSLLCSLLMVNTTNDMEMIQPNVEWKQSCYECALALWSDNTVLSSSPQLLFKCKNYMIVFDNWFIFVSCCRESLLCSLFQFLR